MFFFLFIFHNGTFTSRNLQILDKNFKSLKLKAKIHKVHDICFVGGEGLPLIRKYLLKKDVYTMDCMTKGQ